MPLSPRARRLLRDIDQRLRRGPVVDKPRGKIVDEVLAWLDERHIDPGPRLTHAWLRFDRALLAQIEDAMALNAEAPLSVVLSGMSSLEQACHGNAEEKGPREKPRAYRVLASLPAGAPRPGIAQGTREVLDLDRRRLDLDAFEVLVQVENLDCLYALPAELPALAAWARPLILYRGDSHYGGGFRPWSPPGPAAASRTSTSATLMPEASVSPWRRARRTCCCRRWRGCPARQRRALASGTAEVPADPAPAQRQIAGRTCAGRLP
ncbi:hypothetical protein [Halomonas sp. E19]|uniref:hypothetical protein n=1 Tax=Halomonas sp. E19 TaxID=3397247 RepID=UPI00403315A4